MVKIYDGCRPTMVAEDLLSEEEEDIHPTIMVLVISYHFSLITNICFQQLYFKYKIFSKTVSGRLHIQYCEYSVTRTS
jgi:hypothetical protein